MSKLEVKVTKVKIADHPNANRLQLAFTDYSKQGFCCVVGLNQFRNGQLAVYIPGDSLLPEKIMDWLAKTKIHMSSNRLQAVRIRGVVSEGLCLSFEDLEKMGYGKLEKNSWSRNWQLRAPVKVLGNTNVVPLKDGLLQSLHNGADLAEFLDIKKYEPPRPRFQNRMSGGKSNRSKQRPDFPKYTDIERIEKSPNIFNEEQVIATIKYHGCNARYGYLTKNNKELTLLQRIKKWLFRKEYREFIVGSHNAIRYRNVKQNDPWFKTKSKDVYWDIAKKYDLKRFCKWLATSKYIRDFLDLDKKAFKKKYLDVVVYGEILGPGIQKGYDYGEKELVFRCFDIKIEGKFLGFYDMESLANRLSNFKPHIPTVRAIYHGPYNPDRVLPLAEAIDAYGDWRGNREGIVIRTIDEKWKLSGGRCIKKKINPAYLCDKTNSSFH